MSCYSTSAFRWRFDGLTAAQKVRRALLSAGTRLVAITGFSDEETRSLAKDAGFERYFVKPVDLEKLQDYLRSVENRIGVL